MSLTSEDTKEAMSACIGLSKVLQLQHVFRRQRPGLGLRPLHFQREVHTFGLCYEINPLVVAALSVLGDTQTWHFTLYAESKRGGIKGDVL